MNTSVVYVTAATSEAAKQIGTTIVCEKLAACVNILPGALSIYHWNGAVQTDSEVVLFFKTQTEHVPQLIARVKELHEYDIPCITSWPITEALPEYLEWIVKSTP